MKLFNITLKNFRNFENYHVDLGRKVTIFIGRNGMGKTNLIEGMVQSLSFIFSIPKDTQQYEFIRSTDQGIKGFRDIDPKYIDGNYTYPLALEVEGGIGTDDKYILLKWAFDQQTKKSGLKTSLYKDAYHAFWDYYNTFEEKPVLAYFSDSFPHKDTNIGKGMKEKLKSGNPLPDSDGYYQWDKKQSCVNIWKKYFIQQWINNRLTPNPEKQRFVNAINEKLHGFSLPIDDSANTIDSIIRELSVDYREGEATLLITLEDGTTKPFDTLPAGYERIYSIILDLTSRSYMLNRNTNPEGVVFIDEVDLHLHPSLAAEVLNRLQQAFPRIQFIVSTHSPMVISNFDQSEGKQGDYRLINLLKNDDGYYNRAIDNIYGLDYNSSLVNVMGTKPNEKYKDELIRAYLYWRENDEERAEQIAGLLRKKYLGKDYIISELGL